MVELKKLEDYFPYIGHEIDHQKMFKTKIYQAIVGNLYDKQWIHKINDNDIFVNGDKANSLFSQIKITGISPHISLAKDENAVEVLMSRHRSLFDYLVHQPVHNRLINPNVMILAGDNLFISKFDNFLRIYGAFMFLRGDAYLKRPGIPKVFLSQKRYIDEVFPVYLKQQMIEGVGSKKVKMDMILYAEQEKNPLTGQRGGGRTKTGKLRNLSPIFFNKFKSLVRESKVKLYITAVNISLSKVPEAPYIVHPTTSKGIFKKARYIIEQYFTMVSYPRFTRKVPEAKLEAVIQYGKPELFPGDNLDTVRDVIRYTHTIKERIGRLESVFPLTFLYRAMDKDLELSIHECDQRMKELHNKYSSMGVGLEKISDTNGNMMQVEEIIERSINIVNTNPSYMVKEIKRDNFLKCKAGRIFSNDEKLQAWYANNLRHLDLPAQD